MSETALDFLVAAVGAGQESAGVQLSARADVSHINLRGRVDDTGLMSAATRVLGHPLPTEPNTFNGTTTRTFWMGPDEWHIITDRSAPDLVSALGANSGSPNGACNDVSGGYVYLELTGEDTADVLAKGCTLDLHPQVFKPGTCAQTNLAKCAVLIARPDRQDTFELLVRRSFAEYACLWLTQAARQCGWSLRIQNEAQSRVSSQHS